MSICASDTDIHDGHSFMLHMGIAYEGCLSMSYQGHPSGHCFSILYRAPIGCPIKGTHQGIRRHASAAFTELKGTWNMRLWNFLTDGP